ncbi:MAG: response regulator [Fusobacterium sp.]
MAKKILIVDDERNIRTTLKMCLSGEGYEIETAVNGEDGLEKAEQDKYDLIFLDIKMPGMNGMEVLEELRNRENKTNIIIMTAYGTIEDAVKAMKLHAVDFIPKPFTPDEIRETAKKVFERENLEESKLRTFEDYVEFAKLNIITNNFEKAEEILKQAVGKDPSSPVTHNLLGVISEYKGDILQAQKYYRAALALDPTYKPAESNIRRTVEFDYTTAGIKLD